MTLPIYAVQDGRIGNPPYRRERVNLMFPVTGFSDLRQIRFQISPRPFPDFSGAISEKNGPSMQKSGLCRANSEGDFELLQRLSMKKAAENDNFFRNGEPKFAKRGRFMHAYDYAAWIRRKSGVTDVMTVRYAANLNLHNRFTATVSRFSDRRVDVSRISHRTLKRALRDDFRTAFYAGRIPNPPVCPDGLGIRPARNEVPALTANCILLSPEPTARLTPSASGVAAESALNNRITAASAITAQRGSRDSRDSTRIHISHASSLKCIEPCPRAVERRG